ncbi:inhibitory synaptic factor 1 [Sphaerodactylus townsendi]|uniref:inhibitory synaptic factor 1 n=1 Tax=Sphaerodactylus townsendi TaxID=933632 RepID=UPI002025EBC9|nr:inhibitory synaptic factor 1 [Sphaerodactylus townsendi]
MNSRSLQDRQPTDNATKGNISERERIRGRMKMVIGQLEGILQELKDVAKELRDVVSQIDKLTSDFEFELEPDDWTTATVSSTSSSEKGGGLFDLGHLDFMTSDILSDSWEFCSFLEASTPSDSGDGSEHQQQQGRQPDYRLMNGGVLTPNGPRVETPDSSSEEAFSSAQSHKPQNQRTPGTRERVRFSDKVLYHALCCDDDDEDADNGPPPEDPPEDPRELAHKTVPVAKATPWRSPHLSSAQQRKLTRNSSTQTVSDKSTQTVLPYISAKQKIKGKN